MSTTPGVEPPRPEAEHGEPIAWLESEIDSQVESHSIDVIPESERRGTVKSQFFLWLSANANVFNFVLGGFAIAFGLNVFWALVALVVGTCLGLGFASLHAIQGPRLGVPQMIQSRAQFGFYGAIIFFLATIFLGVGFLAAQQVVQAQALLGLSGSISIPWGIILVTIPALLLALFGYNWIHRVQPALSIGVAIALVVAAIFTFASSHSLAKGMGGTHLASFPVFLTAVGLFFIDQLTWSPFMSDYSRYLPKDVSGPRVFRAVFSGGTIGMVFYAALGIYVTALAPTATSNVASIATIAGTWILPIFAISLITSDAMCAYTGMLSIETIRSSWQKVGASRVARSTGVIALFVIATIMAELGYKSFVNTFSNFIDLLLFFFLPWSVINLLDFYVVRRGVYDVPSFFTPKGVYGGFRPKGLICYGIALVAQVPFLDQTEYTGPLVKVLNGADISWIVGLVVAGVSYLIASRIASRANKESSRITVASGSA